jgi:hypothetical protein
MSRAVLPPYLFFTAKYDMSCSVTRMSKKDSVVAAT